MTQPTPATTTRRPWDWRLAYNHAFWDQDGQQTFHAHDVNDLAACSFGFGLVESIEQPNEGSRLCAECMTVVRQQPQGRPSRSEVPHA